MPYRRPSYAELCWYIIKAKLKEVLRAGIGAAKAQNDDAQRRYIFEAFGKRQLTPRTSSKKLPGAPVGAIRQWGWADYSASVTSASGVFLRTDSTPFRQLSMEW